MLERLPCHGCFKSHHVHYLNKVVLPVIDSPSGITLMIRCAARSCLSSGVKSMVVMSANEFTTGPVVSGY